mgnify:FL=1
MADEAKSKTTLKENASEFAKKAKDGAKNLFQKKNKKKLISITAVILALVIIVLLFRGCGKKTDKSEINTDTVSKGDVTKIIEGSGTIEAIDQYEVTSVGIKGEIISCTFEEGDEVKKDQVLYVIDSSDMQSSIDRANLSIEKAQTSYEDAVKNYNDTNKDMTVTAPTSGVITSLSVENGDKVNGGMQVATIKDNSKMKLTITFNASDANRISVGEAAKVNLENSYSTVNGTVTHVGTGTTVSDEGAVVKYVEISVDNPGAIKDGDKATATVGNIACNDSGTFKSSAEQTVTANLSGDVYALAYKAGDSVNKGDVIFRIDYDNSYSNVKNAKNSLNDAKENLKSLYDDLEDYSIKAPIDGKIVQKNYKQGEKIDNNTSSSTKPLAIISDLSILTFDMNIDELDIANIKVGQEVSITADAYEGEEFSGIVDKVSVVGTSSQGVTTYPVTVIVNSDNKDLLIPGMNVSASIVIEKAENVLRIPVSALRRGNVVIAKTDSDGVESKSGAPGAAGGENAGKQNGSDKNSGGKDAKSGSDNPFLRNLDIPEGYKAIFVESGLSDDDYVEIKAGLNEGDTVVLPDATVSSGLGMFGGMNGGGDGGPQGGPQGGPPSGGGSGGNGGGGSNGGGPRG